MKAYFEGFEIELSLDQARTGSHQGQCDDDVKALLREDGIKAQFEQIQPEKIAAELREFGAWDDEELQDHEENKARILWIACGNVMDELRENPITWTKIKHDVNGNPRYVCHFHALLTDAELNAKEGLMHPWKYAVAVERSHKWGGRKSHNKQYGGGIVFSTYSLKDLEQTIKAYLAELEGQNVIHE